MKSSDQKYCYWITVKAYLIRGTLPTKITRGVVLLIFSIILGDLTMGVVIIIVVKSSNFKDGDVGNLRKIKKLKRLFFTLAYTRKYDLSGGSRYFRT